MDFILFQIRRIIGFFSGIVSAPGEVLGMFWDGSGRSNSFVLGLPAILIGVGGFLSVFLVSWGGIEDVATTYAKRVESNNNRQAILEAELQQSLFSARTEIDGGNIDAEKLKQMRDEDPKSQEIKDLEQASLLYLAKLAELEPDNEDHKFQQALRYARSGDSNRGRSLLERIAPLDKPGHPQAHLQLATVYERQPARSPADKRYNINTALSHVEQCLLRDERNIDALRIKARLLNLKGAKQEAREVYYLLFDQNPVYFEALLNLGVDGAEKTSMLSSAASRYLEELRTPDVASNAVSWVRAWNGTFNVLVAKEDFARLEELLLNDLQRYSQDSSATGRIPFLKQRLCGLYYSWGHSQIDNPVTSQRTFSKSEQLKLLEFYTKAHSYNEKDKDVLQYLTKLTASVYPEVAQAATQIYDPRNTQNIPAGVLNQLALEALAQERFADAQELYERARIINENNPAILNNLAYSYLKDAALAPGLTDEERRSRASRAHKLIDQAIRILPQRSRTPAQVSQYRHTLGEALMQLGNYPSAAAQFEIALAGRPYSEEILKSLISCYKLYDLDASPFQQRLAEAIANKTRGNQP